MQEYMDHGVYLMIHHELYIMQFIHIDGFIHYAGMHHAGGVSLDIFWD